MVTVTRLRLIRTQYHIPLPAIARYTGFSVQHLSRLELQAIRHSHRHEALVTKALGRWIQYHKSEIAQLEEAYRQYAGRLLEPVEVPNDAP